MSYGGRGGFGRGRGGRGRSYAPGKPYELFPDIQLPDRTIAVGKEKMWELNSKLRSFWKNSSYYIRDKENNQSGFPDIETYSGMIDKKDKSKSGDIWQYMNRTNISFTMELIKDGRGSTRPLKKARWSLDKDMEFDDLFEKLEKKISKDIAEEDEAKVEKDKDGESEEEGDKDIAEEDGEFSDDGDYNQNQDFDDDDDDGLNAMEDDYHDEEAIYGD